MGRTGSHTGKLYEHGKYSIIDRVRLTEWEKERKRAREILYGLFRFEEKEKIMLGCQFDLNIFQIDR